MSIFLTLAFLFFIGSVLGWALEVLYRRFFSRTNPDRRWINPGFCTGPWLPLYGNGLCILYLLAGLEAYPITGSLWGNRVLLFLAMMICMTAIEYIAGVLSLKVAKVRLWDYTGCRGNIQGIICPQFSLAWGMLGAIYYFGIHPHIREALIWLSQNLAFSFVIGMFYGVFIIDLAHSAQMTSKMKAFADEHDVIVRYEELKTHIRQFRIRAGMRAYFMFAFRSDLPLIEHLKAAREVWEERKKQ
ncbi:MAG: putative ABC transporter permease [Firmicutes bacterium]|nr:putative ABC transporter permease [Bacillota bacterium]